MARGRFISFEGGEGAGKSTQARLLAEALEKRGLEGRLLAEGRQETFGATYRAKPFDGDSVADVARTILDGNLLALRWLGCSSLRWGGCRRRRGSGVLRVEVGPLDAEVGHVRERSVGIELGGLNRLRLLRRRRGLSKGRSGGQRSGSGRAQQPRSPSIRTPPGHQV